MKTLLIIADSPTLETGFGRVCKNLLSAWLTAGIFDSIEVWGIGYTGWPHSLPVKIYPAQCYEASNWCNPVNLARLARLIEVKKYSHLWVMQDLFLLSSPACLETLGKAVVNGGDFWGMETTCYFPIDAPVDAWWIKFLALVDRPVAYTDYGRAEVLKHPSDLLSVQGVDVIPHGTDTAVYHPLGESKFALRKQLLAGCDWHEDDFLVINVNQNQRRKGLLQTLQTFARLRIQMPYRRFKLYLHMRSVNESEGIDLKIVARELDLGTDVMFGDSAFAGGKALMSEAGLNLLYNAADLLLTTTMGEGWGLSITEAMAAGCPVAGPCHTSLKELLRVGEAERGIGFHTMGHVLLSGDNNRLRPVTDVDDAARMIADAIEGQAGSPSGESGGNPDLHENARRALEWIHRPEFRWEAVAAAFYPASKPEGKAESAHE